MCIRDRINASEASKALKAHIAKGGKETFDMEEFADFMIGILKKHNLCDTEAEKELIRDAFCQVFVIFDHNLTADLDMEEVANLLSIMCGGSINEKIYAAFNLFDVNNSMTLSFDELNRFVRAVFQIFFHMHKQPTHGAIGRRYRPCHNADRCGMLWCLPGN